MSAPQWLLQPEVGLCPCGCIGARRKGSYIDKTIEGGASMLRGVLFADDVAARRGLLQRLDPRVKLLMLGGLLVVTALVRNIAVVLGLYAATLALAAASQVPLFRFVQRVWVFVPIFTGIVVLPATLNVVTPGTIVAPLGTWFGHPLGVTAQGLDAAGLIIARVATSTSVVVLLALTTRWSEILAALRAFFVPRMFVVVLAIAYRYVFHLLSVVIDMFTARKARTVSREGTTRRSRDFVAASAGALFGKSQALADEVHMAMVARGFTGEARPMTQFRIRAIDAMAAGAALALMMAAVGIDRLVFS